jgi:RNA polymerase sigma-70 factor (ECF subfamily)
MQTSPANEYQRYTDEMLLQLVTRKNVGAYETLYDRHARPVYSLLVRIVRDAQVAEELLQEIFWQVWQKAGQYEGSGSAAAWLYRIARNRGLDQLRHRRARPQALQTELAALDRSLRDFEKSAERYAEQSLRRQQVLQALETIPEEQRYCIELAYFDGLSQREIADRTNTPLGTIKTRMRIGLEKLERLLRGAGLTEWAGK